MNTEESQITNDSGSPEPEEKKKKERRKEKKRKQKKRKHRTSDSELENHSRKSKSKSKKRKRSKERKSAKKPKVDNVEDVPGPSVPVELLVEQSKSRAPMTKEEWEKSQNVIRRVYDETGRSRLVKGDGEIIEEIVSKDRHREINRQANIGDGLYFQSKLQTDKK